MNEKVSDRAAAAQAAAEKCGALLEDMVRTAVREALERLQTPKARPAVLVLAERDETLAAKISKRLEDGADIVFWGEKAGNHAPIRRILPFLSCADMAALAVGAAHGPALSETLRLLLAGLKVEVLECEYRSHAETAPPALYALYESHARTLASYGLAEWREMPPAELRCPDRLVTEAAVKRAREAGAASLLVPAGAIVTPLAADAAKELGIAVRKVF